MMKKVCLIAIVICLLVGCNTSILPTLRADRDALDARIAENEAKAKAKEEELEQTESPITMIAVIKELRALRAELAKDRELREKYTKTILAAERADRKTVEVAKDTVKLIVPPPFGQILAGVMTLAAGALGVKSRKHRKDADKQRTLAEETRRAAIEIVKAVEPVMAKASKATKDGIKKLYSDIAGDIVNTARGKKS